MQKKLLTFLGALALFVVGCKVEQHAEPAKKRTSGELSLTLKNITKKTLYTTCFAYLKKDTAPRWRWHKSTVYELPPQQIVHIPIGYIKNPADFADSYGTLGVFNTRGEAERSVYELTPDNNKVDLDKLHVLQDQVVVLGIEKYGVVGDIFDYSFFPKDFEIPEVPELDFTVENATGKPLYVTAFIYQKKESMPIWRYDKSPVVRVENGQEALVDVDTLTNPYDRKYMRGFLAVFDESEKSDAFHSTFQLLQSHQKINIGLLAALRDRKVVLKSQKYGILGDIIDFVVKEPRKIAYSREKNVKYQPKYQG